MFTATEWADALGAEIAARPGRGVLPPVARGARAPRGAKGLTDAQTLSRYADAWGRAAERTPHGTPIELRAGDLE